jgi:hypothetical protein
VRRPAFTILKRIEVGCLQNTMGACFEKAGARNLSDLSDRRGEGKAKTPRGKEITLWRDQLSLPCIGNPGP